MTTIYAKVADLPHSIQSALALVEYHGKDIAITAKEKESLMVNGGSGRRGFAILVNLSTGEIQTHLGSWGGSNMFAPTNQVDNNDTLYPLPVNGCVIHGTQGNKTYASLTLHPDNLMKFLPAKPELSDRQYEILYTLKALTSAGRKDYWNRWNPEGKKQSPPTPEEYQTLADKGLCKVNKAGAVSITTEGKNAYEASGKRFY